MCRILVTGMWVFKTNVQIIFWYFWKEYVKMINVTIYIHVLSSTSCSRGITGSWPVGWISHKITPFP